MRKHTRIRFDTAVRRCFQKLSVPSRAEPRPRPLASGVRCLMSEASAEREREAPCRKRQRQGADDGQPGEEVDLPDLEATARIPGEVPEAAQHVMEERPGV